MQTRLGWSPTNDDTETRSVTRITRRDHFRNTAVVYALSDSAALRYSCRAYSKSTAGLLCGLIPSRSTTEAQCVKLTPITFSEWT